MQVQAIQKNSVTIIALEEKRLDSRLAVSFKDHVNEWIQAGNRVFVLDFSSVEFIDSSGIGCLVSCLKQIGPGGRIAICGVKPSVEAMFKMTRMDRVFKLYPTVEEATQAVIA